MTGSDAEQVRIRPADQPGDIGWMIMAHGEIYHREFGWETSMEALIARIVADYANDHDPAREAAWIAELAGRRVGCVLCVVAGGSDSAADYAAGSETMPTAQLRVLLVDPAARGHGVGARLVDTCLDFARQAGYRRIILWTNDVLVAARRIYEAAGFELVDEEKHHSFGQDLVGQNWARDL